MGKVRTPDRTSRVPRFESRTGSGAAELLKLPPASLIVPSFRMTAGGLAPVAPTFQALRPGELSVAPAALINFEPGSKYNGPLPPQVALPSFSRVPLSRRGNPPAGASAAVPVTVILPGPA